MQLVFQNPYGSLNPRKRIGQILEAPLEINTTLTRAQRQEKARAMLALVGLRPEHYERYPHMFSGGQRQRIALARALYKDTTVLLLDEAFSELDSATEQSFLQYCQQQARTGKIILLITHNNASLSYCNVVVDMDKQ